MKQLDIIETQKINEMSEALAFLVNDKFKDIFNTDIVTSVHFATHLKEENQLFRISFKSLFILEYVDMIVETSDKYCAIEFDKFMEISELFVEKIFKRYLVSLN